MYNLEKTMKEKDIVKFREPSDEEERSSLMVVLEMRETRVLVSDLRFSEWAIPPTSVYRVGELEVICDSSESVNRG